MIGIEAIDITGSGDNILKIAFQDVASISDNDKLIFPAAHSNNALVVNGNAGDGLTLVNYDQNGDCGPLPTASWELVASNVGLDGAADGAYSIYDLSLAGSIAASVDVGILMI